MCLKICLATQSFTYLPHLRNASGRRDFARTRKKAAIEVLGDAKLAAALCFKEPHLNGNSHYHCALISETKTHMWSQLAASLSRRNVKYDARVVAANTFRVCEKKTGFRDFNDSTTI